MPARRLVAATLWVSACYDPSLLPAGLDGDPIDARDGVPGAPEFVPFAHVATPVSALSSSSQEDDPTLTEDQLEIWFSSTRPGGSGLRDLWTATRTSLSEPWPGPWPVMELNTNADDDTPEVSGDGLTLYFSRRDAAGLSTVYQATRMARGAAWGDLVVIDSLDSDGEDHAPVVVAGGQRAYLCSDRWGSQDVFAADADPLRLSVWQAPQPVTTVNSADDDCSPWVNELDTRMAFDSNRTSGSGGDIYYSRRDDPSAAWDSAVLLYASTQIEGDPWLTQDLQVMYFASSQAGDRDLWMVQR